MAYDKPIAVITIACEASGEAHEVKVAVGATILNRVASGRFQRSVAAVCLKRMQFSEWNADTGDNANLERVALMSDEDPTILDCEKAWDEAVAGSDPSNGATHYYDDSIPKPVWAVNATLTAKLGRLNFYKDVR